MEILIARHAGFCFGVERAIGMVKNATTEYDNVVTFGPIIHNPQVVQELYDSGVNIINTTTEVSSDMAVVIRSHGIEKNTYDYLKSHADNLIDAACPFVKKAQKVAADMAKTCDLIVVLGESNHPEVKGIVSYIQCDYKVIEKEEDVLELPFVNKYGFLAQTTQNNDLFEKILEKLNKKCNELSVANTICNATEKRQKFAIDIASKVDVMIVVGGKNSANTTRLYHLCKEICHKTYHIETIDELNKDLFNGMKTVGLTAGASTPTYLLEKVRKYILGFKLN